jgi:hypothetical protein
MAQVVPANGHKRAYGHFALLVVLGLVFLLQSVRLVQIQIAQGAAARDDAVVGEERMQMFLRGIAMGNCPLGKFYESVTQECIACPMNTFKNTSNLETLCTPCPPHSGNDLQTGSKSASDCVIIPIRIDVCGIKPVTLVNMDPIYEAHNVATCDPNPESDWIVECFGEYPCGYINVNLLAGTLRDGVCAADWGVAEKGKRVECAESRGGGGGGDGALGIRGGHQHKITPNPKATAQKT